MGSFEMTKQEIRDNKPRLADKVRLTKEQLSKIGLQQLNAYKFKRKRRNTTFLEL